MKKLLVCAALVAGLIVVASAGTARAGHNYYGYDPCYSGGYGYGYGYSRYSSPYSYYSPGRRYSRHSGYYRRGYHRHGYRGYGYYRRGLHYRGRNFGFSIYR